MIEFPIQDVLPWGLHRGVLLDFFFSRVCLQHCEHSSAPACDVFVTFACNLSGRASAIERGSFRPVGFGRLQMQKWKSVRFVARTGVSPALQSDCAQAILKRFLFSGSGCVLALEFSFSADPPQFFKVHPQVIIAQGDSSTWMQ